MKRAKKAHFPCAVGWPVTEGWCDEGANFSSKLLELKSNRDAVVANETTSANSIIQARGKGRDCRSGGEGVIKVLRETRPCFSQCQWQETKALRQFCAQDKMEMYVLSSRCIHYVSSCVCMRGWNRLGSSMRWPPRRGKEVEHGMIILCSLSSSATGSVLIDSLSFPSCRSTWASFEKGFDHFTFLSYRHASVVRNNHVSTIVSPGWRYMYILKLRERRNERGKFFESRLGLQFRPIIDSLRECHRFLDF